MVCTEEHLVCVAIRRRTPNKEAKDGGSERKQALGQEGRKPGASNLS